jgi:hypothetical protein
VAERSTNDFRDPTEADLKRLRRETAGEQAAAPIGYTDEQGSPLAWIGDDEGPRVVVLGERPVRSPAYDYLPSAAIQAAATGVAIDVSAWRGIVFEIAWTIISAGTTALRLELQESIDDTPTFRDPAVIGSAIAISVTLGIRTSYRSVLQTPTLGAGVLYQANYHYDLDAKQVRLVCTPVTTDEDIDLGTLAVRYMLTR